MTTDPSLFPVSDLTEDLVGRPGDVNDMLRTAHLSDDLRYRWDLRRTWGNPARALPWIMLNPSTADALKDDPTIQRCIGFARRLGYDGIRVVNLYAFRTPHPAALTEAGYDTGGRTNDQILREVLAGAWLEHVPVIAAWGNNAQPDRIAWLMDQPGVSGPPDGTRGLTCLGATLSGAPKHPLARGRSRIPDDTTPTAWPPRP